MGSLAFDTETEPFAPYEMVPRLVCLTVPGKLYLPGPELRPVAERLLDGCTGANTPYDIAQLCREFPDLIPDVWCAYAENRVTDVQTRQKLIDIGKGDYKRIRQQEFSGFSAYSLAGIYYRYTGKVLGKGEVRTSFRRGDVLTTTQERYAILDAEATQHVHDAQATEVEFLVDEYRQARARWFLFLMSAWGFTTDPEAAAAFAANVEKRFQDLRDMCVRSGLVRPDDSRDTLKAKARMLGASRELGFEFKITKTGLEQMRDAKKGKAKCLPCRGKGTRAKKYGGGKCCFCNGSGLTSAFSREDWICLDAEACAESGDTYHLADGQPYPLWTDLDAEEKRCTKDDVGEPQPGYGAVYGGLEQYSEYVTMQKLRGTDIPNLTKPIIHTRFEEVQDTGRTGSSKPNIQNLPRAPGVRECFVARPGTLLVDCDYDILELRTFAQILVWLFGGSVLADKLNAGYDPHMFMGASLIGITDRDVCCHKDSYDRGILVPCSCTLEMHARKKQKDAKKGRQNAKPINFGVPGGMGPPGIRRYAKSAYHVDFTLEEATRYRELFLDTWQAREYFTRLKKDLTWGYDAREVKEKGFDDAKTRTTIEHFVSGRLRGKVSYTVAANSFFQGLAADLAKAAGFRIARECYDPTQESVLFGCRPVNFIHDQFLVEAPEEYAAEAAERVAWIMCDESRNWIPDVPATVQPALCRRYSKGTEAVYKDGRLVPWENAA